MGEGNGAATAGHEWTGATQTSRVNPAPRRRSPPGVIASSQHGSPCLFLEAGPFMRRRRAARFTPCLGPAARSSALSPPRHVADLDQHLGRRLAAQTPPSAEPT